MGISFSNIGTVGREQLITSGSNVRVSTNITGETIVECNNMRITLKGLEYLQENSIMRKIYNAAKGIKEITPGL